MTLTLALVAAFGIAALSPLLARFMGRDAGWPLAALLAGLALFFWFAIPVDTSSSVSWMPALGIELRLVLDPLARVFAMLVPTSSGRNGRRVSSMPVSSAIANKPCRPTS